MSMQNKKATAYRATRWQILAAAIALWPVSAWSCSGGVVLGISFAVLELAVAGFLLLLWWGAGKFRPEEPARSASFRSMCLVVAAAISLGLGLSGIFFIPEFDRLFENFGVNLPDATRFVRDNGHLLWLTMAPVAALWWISRSRAIRVHYFVALCNIEVGFYYWALWALYLPIFKMC